MTNQTGFILFRNPYESIINFWELDSAHVNAGSYDFIVKPFKEDPTLYTAISKTSIIDISKHKDAINESFNKTLKNNISPNTLFNESYYKSLVQKAIDSINQKELNKVVVSRIVNHTFSNSIDIVESFINLLSHTNAFVYAAYFSNYGLWLGATPELLIEKEHNYFKTYALAGTLTHHETWTTKEIIEQKLVTEFIKQTLESLSVINLKVSDAESHVSGIMKHLKSEISWESDLDLSIFLSKLHPTPAVGGLPQSKATDFILKNESHKRLLYTGYLGWINQNTSKIFVNLRCSNIFLHEAHIYVGGGIINSSNPQKEWQESELKSSTILKALKTN